jgi:transcriptional regulator with XRE-family HTH domain
MNNSEVAAQADHRLRQYVAESVEHFRQKNNLTVVQLAAKVGLPLKTIKEIQNQRYELRVIDLLKISPALEVQAWQLLRILGL